MGVPAECCLCASITLIRRVRLRANGKATVYDRDPVWLCAKCRVQFRGSWKHAGNLKPTKPE